MKKTVAEGDAPNTGSWVCEVVVTNTGVIHVPVEIEPGAEGRLLRERFGLKRGALKDLAQRLG